MLDIHIFLNGIPINLGIIYIPALVICIDFQINKYQYFYSIFTEIIYAFKPNAMVVQCGADCLSNDPLGGFNLSPIGIGNCLKKILSKNIPTLFLGGGGYNKVFYKKTILN